MGVVELELTPVPIDGGVNYGDTHAPHVAGLFTPGSDPFPIGKNAKNGDEITGFFRFDVPAATPIVLNVRKVKLQLRAGANATVTDTLSVAIGVLIVDGKWDDAGGFRLTPAPGEYTGNLDLPFPTGPGNDVITAGVLLFDQFVSPTIGLLAVDWTTGSVRSFGEGYTVDYATTAFITQIQGLLRAGRRQFGIVVDPIGLGIQHNDIHVNSGDSATDSFRPRLFIEYETGRAVRSLGLELDAAVLAAESSSGPAVQVAGGQVLEPAISVAAEGSSGPAVKTVGADVQGGVKIAGYTLEEGDG